MKGNQGNAGPVDNSESRQSLLLTLPLRRAQIVGGLWAGRQQVNRGVSLQHGYDMLEKAGNFRNLRIAAGREQGEFQGRNFYDEDVYKWLEALGWELGRAPDPALQAMADEMIDLLAAVQMPDGYLNSYYQTAEPDQKWADMDHGHELYCAGHLIQAAVAFHRAVDDGRLLAIVNRFVDHIYDTFGPGKREETCGHPEIETALAELYRATGDPRHLELVELFVDRRGRNRMRGHAGYGADYHQDHVPVRDAQEVAGHAVRQMYLTTGATDLYMETGEEALLDAMRRLWGDMATRKIYLTGGVGSRFDGESFGAPYELPTDTCYCETCAAIGSLMWNWRMLLLTGDRRYADLFERTLYNGVLASPGLEGQSYLYVNPLLVRGGRYVRASSDVASGSELSRPAWHYVACCPPNVMRLFSSLSHYLATSDTGGIQLHQFATARLDVELAGAPVTLAMGTNYPWDGKIDVRIEASGSQPWTLALRHPAWCDDAEVRVNGEVVGASLSDGGYWTLARHWKAGDTVTLDLRMEPRFVLPNPRVDAVRGCVAIERGPLVYCFEGQDQKEGVDLMDVEVDTSVALRENWQGALLGGLVVVEAAGLAEEMSAWHGALYRPLAGAVEAATRPVALKAIPYYAWGNRGMGSMRVWMPAAPQA